MNFRKILFIVSAMILIFTSCKKSKDLSDAIPADANYVVHVDAKALVDKSQYDIFSNPTVQQGINFYKALLKDEDKIKVLDDFLKDSNSIGLELKNDLYMYTNYKVYGIVVGVNNAQKVKDMLVKFSLAKEEDIKKNGKIYSLSPETLVSVSWDDSRLVLLINMTPMYGQNAGVESVNVEELAIELLNQGADKSINSNPSYADFSKGKKDFNAFYSIKGINDLPFFTQLPTDVEDMVAPFRTLLGDMAGVSIGTYSSFEKGEITMVSKYFYETADDERKFKEHVAKLAGSLKGDHLKYIPADPLFMASINLKGDGIYSFLNDLKLIDRITEELPDSVQPAQIEEFMKNFNGDITFAVSTVKENALKISEIDEITGEKFEDEITTTIPECIFFVDVADPAYTLSFIKEQMDKNGGKYQEINPTSYQLTEKGLTVYYGTYNNTFYATNAESVYNSLNSNDLKSSYSDVIKGKMVLISGDIKTIKPYLEGRSDFSKVIPILDEFGKYQITTSADDFTGEAKLEFVNKEKNSLAVICEQIDKLISDLSSSMRF